ncbi:biopolymer transporter ExbD [bacterium SCSIO 12741]|nr:biopolymer transporter ExbD [bacterium SCSIO 12741]
MKYFKELPSINASSMADIAFLLLVFFLVTTTMDTEYGLGRILPPDNDVTHPPVERKRNLMIVLINGQDELLVEGELLPVQELKDKVREFILNPDNLDHLPEKREKEIPGLGKRMVSRQLISLQNDAKTSYNQYIQVQNELARAYKEARNELARKEFGITYEELIEKGEKEKVLAIRKLCPMRISEATPYVSER